MLSSVVIAAAACETVMITITALGARRVQLKGASMIASKLLIGIVLAVIAADEWKEGFKKHYALSEGQSLRLIPPPFIDEREDAIAARRLTTDPAAIRVEWADEAVIAGSIYTTRGPALEVETLLRFVLGMQEWQIVAPEEFRTIAVLGDWTVRKGAGVGQLLDEFVKIVSADIGQDWSLAAEQFTRDVIVVTGHLEPPENLNGKGWVVLIDCSDIGLGQLFQGYGNAQKLTDAIGRVTGWPTVAELDQDQPNQELLWRTEDVEAIKDRGDEPELPREELDRFLERIGEKTGLQFKVQQRALTRWRVSLAK